jgi:hypothetical protein
VTELETLKFIKQTYGAMISEAALQYRHRPEVLAGIMMRESGGGTSPLLDKPGPEGRGDGGHGHGLMQIDDRSFPTFCSINGGELWKNPAININTGAWILSSKRIYIEHRLLSLGMRDDEIEQASIAAYNCGEGNVVRAIQAGLGCDHYTAHGNYSADVLRLAEIYLGLEAS